MLAELLHRLRSSIRIGGWTMTNNAKVDQIVKKNRKLNQDSLAKVQNVAERARRLGLNPPKYNLATPMTPRQLPPVDYNNHLARAEKTLSRKTTP